MWRRVVPARRAGLRAAHGRLPVPDRLGVCLGLCEPTRVCGPPPVTPPGWLFIRITEGRGFCRGLACTLTGAPLPKAQVPAGPQRPYLFSWVTCTGQ